MHTIYLGLGSNLGDRAANLRTAIKSLPPEVVVAAQSPIYETPPWGVVDQPAYLNMVLRGETDLPPMELRDHVKHIEAGMGREPTYHWGPRLIDIDILFYDDLVVDTPELVIPHPRLHKRGFVLLPLSRLAGDLVHPGIGLTVRELLRKADTGGIVEVANGG